MIRYSAALYLLLVSGPTLAHHSTLGFFNPDEIVVIDGEISSVSWRNPHVRFEVAVTDESGATATWKLESSALSVLRTRGLDRQFMNTGDRVRVAGNPSRNGGPEMSATNILLADGTEVVMENDAAPYFTDPATGRLLDPVFDEQVAQAARDQADGIFRVWSTVMDDPAAFPLFKGGYPLTEEALQLESEWNPGATDLRNCWEKGMPLLMITPIPVEFVRQGEDILIRFEEDDAERFVHMNTEVPSADESYSLLGYSTGSWDGDTLVVETTNIDAPLFDYREGTPQSTSISLVERFTLNDEQNRLDYRITISDPKTFTESFDLTRYWIWRPEIALQEWDCSSPA